MKAPGHGPCPQRVAGAWLTAAGLLASQGHRLLIVIHHDRSMDANTMHYYYLILQHLSMLGDNRVYMVYTENRDSANTGNENLNLLQPVCRNRVYLLTEM